MKLSEVPAEVALAISGLLSKLIISVLTSVFVMGAIWALLDDARLLGAFIGAMIAQVMIRGL